MQMQIIGVALGITGFLTGIYWLLILGGILCLVIDLIGFASGKLKPLTPILLYIGGIVITQSFIGILYGSIIGNIIDVVPTLFSLITSSDAD